MGKRRTAQTGSQPVQTLLGSVVVAELDLHGLTADQAERRTENFLRTQARAAPGKVVRIITGRGNRSEGAPVLKARVAALLAQLPDLVSDYAAEPGGGSFLARMQE